MGQGTDQARQQVELTRVALAADIDKLERRIRAELDWKARLRRDGPQIVAIAGAVVIVAVGVVVLRGRFGGTEKPAATGRKVGPSDRRPANIDELAAEVRALREELQGRRKGKGGGAADAQPLWQKLAVRGATAGAAAGASMLARRYARQAQQVSEHVAPGV